MLMSTTVFVAVIFGSIAVGVVIGIFIGFEIDAQYRRDEQDRFL